MNRKNLALAVVKDAIDTSHRRRKSPPPDEESKEIISVTEMTEKARWIRDVLEPGVAVYGPSHLPPDVVLSLYTLFENLLVLTNSPHLTFKTLQTSRIHRALLLVTGRGTRWPEKLIDVADKVVEAWVERFGKLDLIRPVIFGRGGRLEGMGSGLEGDDAVGDRGKLLLRWLSDPTSLVSPLRALEHGHLEFSPGQWWINAFYAFHDGIIDTPDAHGGITSDSDGAYAITLTDHDEVAPLVAVNKRRTHPDLGPDQFTYRCRNDDLGRFRLVNAILPPHPPLRILRSHTLHSLWAPVAGLRYDGLYRVTKYSMLTVKGQLVFDVTLRREPGQIDMKDVYQHPNSAEIDDYIEYKRMRDVKRAKKNKEQRSQSLTEALKEIPNEANKHLQQLSIGQALETEIENPVIREDDDEDTSRRVMMRKSAIDHGLQRRVSDDTITERRESPLGSQVDGTSSAPDTPCCSHPEAHKFPSKSDVLAPSLTRQISTGIQAELRAKLKNSLDSGSLQSCDAISNASKRSFLRQSKSTLDDERAGFNDNREDEKELRKDSGYGSNRGSAAQISCAFEFQQSCKTENNAHEEQSPETKTESFDWAEDTDFCHATLYTLTNNVQELADAFTRRGFVSATLVQDMRKMQEILTEWRKEWLEKQNDVDWCFVKVDTLVEEMRAWSDQTKP